jgi:toxin HigB-1
MAVPGWNLHPLKGEEAGRWSVLASGNWRITFSFEDGHATEVDYVDYH